MQLTQSRFGIDAVSKTPRTWRTPITVAGLGAPWQTMVSASLPVAKGAAPGAVPLVNAGQNGYFRSRYAGDLSDRIAAAAATLPPIDQLGLIYDSQALGQAGYAPMGDFLAIAKNVQGAGDAIVLKTLAQQLGSLIDLYRGQPGAAAYAAFARARLAPAYARVGWDAKPGESDNDAVLRRTLLATLGRLDDPSVVAEARRRFDAWLAAPESLTGTTRQTVLQIVADHADPVTWEQFHVLAQKATDPTDKTRFYHYLGVSHDPALADKALALSLTKDPPATDAPELISGVAAVYPDKAFDFAVAHLAAVDAMVEPTSRTSFLAHLANGSHDAAILPKLKAFAATVPASARGEVAKAVSTILYQQVIVSKRLPEVDR